MTLFNLNELDDITTEPKTIVKKGELWQLGKHRLLCGDATIKADVEKLMDGAKVDMVFTDPPYNVNYNDYRTVERKNIILGGKFKHREKIQNDNIKDIEKFFYKACKNISMILNDYNSFYICMSGKSLDKLLNAINEAKLQINNILVWNKNSMVLSFADYYFKHELIIYGWKNRHRFYHKGKYRSSVWDIPKPHKSELHPTMKPIELIENAIKNSTLENHIVYDCFLGSGSTLIACEYTNRICYGIEIDEHYCGVIIDRWEKFTRKKARRQLNE